MSKWTTFWDMNSGGGQKEDYKMIYIEAPEEEAEVIFYNRFGHNPNRVSCTCCGSDYSIDESDSLEEATGYHRGCKYDGDKGGYIDEPSGESYRPYMTMEEYENKEDVLIIRKEEIKAEEREGDVPAQGYVWM